MTRQAAVIPTLAAAQSSPGASGRDQQTRDVLDLQHTNKETCMKRTIITGSTLLICGLVCANVAAEIEAVSGANLKKICESYLDIPSNSAEGMCLGYVVGVMSVVEYINVVCQPVKSTHSQATLVVQKYLTDHPEKLHINAEELVINALQEAFPCTEIKPGH